MEQGREKITLTHMADKVFSTHASMIARLDNELGEMMHNKMDKMITKWRDRVLGTKCWDQDLMTDKYKDSLCRKH